MSTIAVNETELFYLQVGHGTPCLVMHGGLGVDHTYLRPWLDALGDFLHLIYYDHRGNGRSAHVEPATITFENLCADAESLRRTLGFERVAVLGHSFGGHIALEYALRYPQSISHLIVVDTAARDPDNAAVGETIQRLHPELLNVAFRTPTTDDDLRLYATQIGPLYFRNYDPAMARYIYRDTHWRIAGWRNAVLLRDWDLRARLQDIATPTLVVVGRHDIGWPPSEAQILADGIPNAELAVFEDSGHLPFVEQPREFTAAIREWLRRHG